MKMKKTLKYLIPVVTVAVAVLIVLVCGGTIKDSADASAIISLNYENELVNTADGNYKPVTYGELAFTKNGMVNSALEFKNGHLELTGSETLNIKDSFTFLTWIKVTDTKTTDPIIFCREASDGNIVAGPLNIHFSENYTCLRTEITFVDRKGNYISGSFVSDDLWSAETVTSMWHHVAVVFDKDKLSYYVDGNLLNTIMVPEELKNYKTIANNSKIFVIGAGADSDMFGILDETEFFTRALNEEEIKTSYDAAKKEYKNTLVLKPGSDVAIYNGQTEKLPVPITRDKETERLMVPLRFVTDRMGGSINWDGSDGYGRADIVLGENQISIWLMDTNALSNHKYCKLDAYPQEINDTMCVPIRFVAEELGASVNWNEEKEEVTILF